MHIHTKYKKRASVSISKETKGFLDSIKHTGQSYDGLMRELVVCWKEKKEVEAKKGNPETETKTIKGSGNAGINEIKETERVLTEQE